MVLDEVTHQPIEVQLLPSRDEVLVTPYQRPEREGLIILPAAWSQDRTQTLWEPHEWTAEAEAALGCQLTDACILVTLRRWPRHTGCIHPDSFIPVFILSISAAEVRGIITYAADNS